VPSGVDRARRILPALLGCHRTNDEPATVDLLADLLELSLALLLGFFALRLHSATSRSVYGQREAGQEPVGIARSFLAGAICI
jgi:hypothetical protein